MLMNDKIWMAQGDVPCCLLLNQANRHGLIAGASGTGKTVTLKVMAEGFSEAGVPVFMADVKGDVTGMCQAGEMSDGFRKRLDGLGIGDWELRGNPCRLWDMLGETGIPVRVTVSQMGPELLARLLGLTDVQKGVLNIVFRVADDRQMLLLDLKDLRAMLSYVGEHAKEFEMDYGRVSSASVGAILRALISVEDQGGDVFFGEPAIELEDWFDRDSEGRGYINILDATKLINHPQVYAMFLLWMLSDLFETLPEEGDLDKPKFVFFFDEAHLLFDDMPKELEDKIVQVVKLIRSKGVGVYFITQSPSDIPDEVLAQLSNRIQHSLRAYTPAEQKAVKAAATSFRANPAFDATDALQEMGTGEALVSFLDEKGTPCVVEKATVLSPHCLMGKADASSVDKMRSAQAGLQDKYGTAIDRESAYEMINEQSEAAAAQAKFDEERKAFEAEKAAFEKQRAAEAEKERKAKEREDAKAAREAEREQQRLEREAEKERQRFEREMEKERERERKAREKEEAARKKQQERLANQIFGTAGREVTRQVVRGILKNFKL